MHAVIIRAALVVALVVAPSGCQPTTVPASSPRPAVPAPAGPEAKYVKNCMTQCIALVGEVTVPGLPAGLRPRLHVIVDAVDQYGDKGRFRKTGSPYPFDKLVYSPFINQIHYGSTEIVATTIRVYAVNDTATVIVCRVFHNGHEVPLARTEKAIPRGKSGSTSVVCRYTGSG